MRINEEGLDIVKSFEGLSLSVYKCPSDKWTIGWGSTYDLENKPITKHHKDITEQEAEDYLLKGLEDSEEAVRTLVEVPLNSNQFSALVSLVYNIGRGNFSHSTMLKHLNRKDYGLASEEFPKWRKSGGRVLKGLERRRAKELELFLKEEGA